jgi:hypothetical protein
MDMETISKVSQNMGIQQMGKFGDKGKSKDKNK